MTRKRCSNEHPPSSPASSGIKEGDESRPASDNVTSYLGSKPCWDHHCPTVGRAFAPSPAVVAVWTISHVGPVFLTLTACVGPILDDTSSTSGMRAVQR